MSGLNLPPATANELFVIDGALADVQALIEAIGPGKWIVVLDSQRDGVLELAELLRDESGLDAAHLLSHGGIGSLRLGTAVLNQASLESYSAALRCIGNALSETGDLLLYGCNVAQGVNGQVFVEHLAQITSTDLAASVDATGSALLGGDWQLEARIGTVESTNVNAADSAFEALLAEAVIRWDVVLAVKDTPFKIPAYGRYGGPRWIAGERDGTVVIGPEQLDDLDQLFKIHDAAYTAAEGLQTEEAKFAAMAAADSAAINGMMGLTYVPGTDRQAYAGATTLSFLHQIEFTYHSVYSGNSVAAADFGIHSLYESIITFEAVGDANQARKIEFTKWVFSNVSAFAQSHGLDQIQAAGVAVIAGAIYVGVVALDPASRIGTLTLDFILSAGVPTNDATSALVAAAAKALIGLGGTVIDIGELGKRLVAESMTDRVEYLYGTARKIVDAGIAVTDVINHIGGEFSHALRDNVADFNLADDIGLLFFNANINVTGNALDNRITGNNGDNILNAGAGNDIVYAGSGDDVIDVGRGSADVEGGAGFDRLTVDLSDAVGSLLYRFGDSNGFSPGYGSANSFEQLHSVIAGVKEFQIFNGAFVQYRNVEAVNITMGAGDDLLLFHGGTHYDGGAGIDTFYADFSTTTQALSWDADANTFTPVEGVKVANIERFLLVTGSGNDLLHATQGGLSHHVETGAGNDTIELGAGNDYVDAGSGNDIVSGGSGSDWLAGGGGDDLLSGGVGDDTLAGDDGTDTAAFIGTRASSSFIGNAGNWTVTTAGEGIDSLIGVERLKFSNANVALDLSGNAGNVAKILGAVFGAPSVSNQTYFGIGLYYMDSGMTYEAVMQLALDAALGANASHTAVVTLLYTNVVGVAPSAGELTNYVGILDRHELTVGTLGVVAADYYLNTDRINLIGLGNAGVEFIPFPGG